MSFSNKLNNSIKSQRHKAFTLAEVLITLGIIGVVAVMTIPTLVNTIDDRQHISAWKKSYSEISQAIALIKVDRGNLDYAGGYPSAPQEFYSDFISKMSVIKSSRNQDDGGFYWYGGTVAPSKDYQWYNLKGQACASPNAGYPSGMLKNGTLFYLAGISPFEILIDVNGYKKPNIVGKDIFGVRLYQDGRVVPGGSLATMSFIGANSTSACFDGNVTVGQACDSTQVGWGCSSTKLKE